MHPRHDVSYTQNRELSWLKFNERVLLQAKDATVPLFEQLKFLSIFVSNLDEFFMVRVGSLTDLTLLKADLAPDNKSGMTPQQQLDAIFAAVPALYALLGKTYAQVEDHLRHHDVACLEMRELTKKERKYVDRLFHDYIAPVLSPQIIDPHHPFPHLVNKELYIAVSLLDGNRELFGLLPVPTSLPPLFFLPGNSVRYLLTERIIAAYTEKVFEMYQVKEQSIICVTRNADINLAREGGDEDDDYRHFMKRILKKRGRLAAVRLEAQDALSADLTHYLCDKLRLSPAQVFVSSAPLSMQYIFSLPEHFPPSLTRSLQYPAFDPQQAAMVNPRESMMRQVQKRDILLCYPYESMDSFLRLIKEAAHDPSVISIRITIYRLAKQSKLVEHLIEAAENGKEVTALLELRARFDEQNNIDYAEVLEQAGCTVLYGFENFKVHAKLCLITRREKSRISYITQIGTGNYNEKTARLYTDYCLMTANQQLGEEAALFFKNMLIANLEAPYQHLLVSPCTLKPRLLQLIQQQAQQAMAGESAYILIKINSLTDRELIDALAEASQCGVRIDLIVRGICCLLPGIKGKTEGIRVISIVGRFLEHARVYCFGQGREMQMYISSADLMTRNTEKRVEVGCPVWDKDVMQRIFSMLQTMLQDNVKGRMLQPDGTYRINKGLPETRVDSQIVFLEQARKSAQTPAHMPLQSSIRHTLRRMYARLRRNEP